MMTYPDIWLYLKPPSLNVYRNENCLGEALKGKNETFYVQYDFRQIIVFQNTHKKSQEE
jgi:hypothetical protein